MKKKMFLMFGLLLAAGTSMAQEPLSIALQKPAAVRGQLSITNEVGTNFRSNDNFLLFYGYVVKPGLRFNNNMTLSLPITGGINAVNVSSDKYVNAWGFAPDLKLGLQLGYDWKCEDASILSLAAGVGGTVASTDYKALYYDLNISVSGGNTNSLYGLGVRYFQGLDHFKNHFCIYASYGIIIK